VENQARRSALRDFLTECRARLRPEDVGLVSVGRRRVRGLRREEVAELAHISPSWYTLLETAHSIRVSPRMLDRLSAALQLNEDEKRHLFSLAIDEMPAYPRATIDSAGSLGHEYSEIRIFTKRSRAASNMQELADLTTDLLFDLSKPEFAYFVEANVANGQFAFSWQRGSENVPSVSTEWFDFSAVHDAQEVLVDGGLFAENNVEAAPHVFRERAQALGMGRFISAGVKGPKFDGAIGYFQGECEPYSERERSVLGLIAEIVHLALAVRI
jgi:transcriptional regulator with XRE-family HTH domain